MTRDECVALLTREFHKLQATNDLQEWSDEFATYCNMVASCYDPEHPRYATQGAKGVTVKDEWLVGFQEFLAEVGPTPAHKKEMELDALVLIEAEKLILSDQISADWLKGKVEEIQHDMKDGRKPSEEDAVKFTAVLLSGWYLQRVENDPSTTLLGSLKRFKNGERP